MLARLSISMKGLILVAVPIFFELVFISTLVFGLANAEHEAWKESHYRAVVSEANNLTSLFYKSVSLLVTYGGLKSQETKDLFMATEQKIRSRLRFLSALVAEDQKPGNSLDMLEKSASRLLYLMDSNIAQFETKDEKVAVIDSISTYGATEVAMLDVLKATRAMVDEQAGAKNVNPKAEENARNFVRVLICVGVAFNIVIAFWLALFFGKEISLRLKVVVDNISRMSMGKDLNPKLGGADEIARLDEAFHFMTEAVAEAHRKERAVVDNALDVICSLSAKGIFLKVNPASLQRWGYQPESLIGQELKEIVIPDDRELTERALAQVIEGVSTKPFENRVARKDGSVADLSWSAFWSAKEGALFCVAHDISARKQAERFKQQLMQMVSHDLRSPLASIQNVNEMLLAGVYGELPERAAQPLRLSDANSARLIRLVNDLLDFEKMEAGKIELNYHEVSSSDLIEQSIAALSAFAAEYEIELVAISQNLQFSADGDRLIQVIVNLLSNSIKFSPRKTTVTLSASLLDGFVEFRIADQGPGIPEDARLAIFERFRQISSMQRGQKVKGTGLGLSICKGFVEAHGGVIGVDSELGKGSTFWFKIPEKPAASPADAGSH